MDDSVVGPALAAHIKHCTGCDECRRVRHVPAAVARAILNPGQTDQTAVPVPPPPLSPASEERAVHPDVLG